MVDVAATECEDCTPDYCSKHRAEANAGKLKPSPTNWLSEPGWMTQHLVDDWPENRRARCGHKVDKKATVISQPAPLCGCYRCMNPAARKTPPNTPPWHLLWGFFGR